MAEANHSIRAVARRSGLSAHVIRIWEKRYGAVRPERSDTNRRLYSEEQVERLLLLRELTHAGHSIGMVAKLPTARLRELARGAQGVNGQSQPARRSKPNETLLEECVGAVKSLDSRALDAALKRGSMQFGGQGLLQQIIAPMAERI
jgi:MerR family transcriptional regulator, light-induced transcriptional regulator